jgi:hypothetical protein
MQTPGCCKYIAEIGWWCTVHENGHHVAYECHNTKLDVLGTFPLGSANVCEWCGAEYTQTPHRAAGLPLYCGDCLEAWARMMTDHVFIIQDVDFPVREKPMPV